MSINSIVIYRIIVAQPVLNECVIQFPIQSNDDFKKGIRRW